MHFTKILRSSSEPPAMIAVRQALKAAMKANNVLHKTALKAVMAAVKNADIAKSGSMKSNLAFAGLLGSLIKTRLQSAEEYVKGNRIDLAENERGEVSVLKELKKQLDIATPEQIEEKLKSHIKDLGVDLNAKDAFKNIIAGLPKDMEETWNASRSAVVSAIKAHLGQRREYSTNAHENPLGLRRRSNPNQGNNDGGKKRIKTVGKVVLVSSAKGGVGKSTVSANLAHSLHQLGHNVGLLDIDIFGPSIPKMLGLATFGEPRLNSDGSKLLPLIGHGIKSMSMGFLVPSGKSVSWRGLLVQKALQQLLFEVEWGPTDYLVVDMPPGTGDVQLTVGQQLHVDGAVLVSTPQQIALIDAERGLDLFRRLEIPVLGWVENMSFFECSCCQERTRIFGPSPKLLSFNGERLEKLAEIPLEPTIALESDTGTFRVRDSYLKLAESVVKKLV